jgi:hypothetical protein
MNRERRAACLRRRQPGDRSRTASLKVVTAIGLSLVVVGSASAATGSGAWAPRRRSTRSPATAAT